MKPVELPAWPGGAEVAVCLTFDVDSEPGFLCEGDEFARRLTTLSEARFGAVRGVPRILDLLAEHGVPGTFYVPGQTAEMHPDPVRAIVDGGHEIGHHGYAHLRSERIDEKAQREELDRGFSALHEVAGVQPVGYRSPAWEVTAETFRMLIDIGFDYDSSFMGDDRPYIEEQDGAGILEFPVHWSLDDWPHFGWSIYTGGALMDPEHWRQTQLAEYRWARRDRSVVTFTMHPEIIGRGYRFDALRKLVEELKSEDGVWFATHREVAAVIKRAQPVGAESTS